MPFAVWILLFGWEMFFLPTERHELAIGQWAWTVVGRGIAVCGKGSGALYVGRGSLTWDELGPLSRTWPGFIVGRANFGPCCSG